MLNIDIEGIEKSNNKGYIREKKHVNMSNWIKRKKNLG